MKAFIAALLLIAAAPGPLAAQAIVSAQPTLRTIPLRLVTAARTYRLRVEVAATPREQQIGMMFRTQLPRGKGMLFPFASPRRLSFWMENTVIPLDLVFVSADGRIVNVAANAKPYSQDLIPSQGPAVAVLELAGGEAARMGLRPGDRVEYTLP
ncbi:DUF192 domain-containing protein [Glacieibacterium frigidum]|uniref:DUF192 domain-containing protein n=1 Tax=Glacieibacterium frigidum TaxID=2593303 RepID=UPI001F4512B9|nr:DUF192 domain-containing protein [Glacieibacterium frigidum]